MLFEPVIAIAGYPLKKNKVEHSRARAAHRIDEMPKSGRSTLTARNHVENWKRPRWGGVVVKDVRTHGLSQPSFWFAVACHSWSGSSGWS